MVITKTMGGAFEIAGEIPSAIVIVAHPFDLILELPASVQTGGEHLLDFPLRLVVDDDGFRGFDVLTRERILGRSSEFVCRNNRMYAHRGRKF